MTTRGIERGGNPNNHNGNERKDPPGRESVKDRAALVERWRNAPEWVEDYPGGIGYEAGTRLYMQDDPNVPPKEVMDTCQAPWAQATVDRAFEALGNKKGVHVLERGFGMGIVASRIMDHLRIRDGTYTVIELNQQDAKFAGLNWTNNQGTIDTQRAAATQRSERPYNGPNIVSIKIISIKIIEGDAYEETRKLAEEERKFDIIISDTFPLSEEERGINDLIDLQTLKRCLAPDGVFAFFGYFTGSTGGIGSLQRDIVNEHFAEYSVTEATVNPPPNYKYLNPSTGVIRRLPVIICRGPKL